MKTSLNDIGSILNRNHPLMMKVRKLLLSTVAATGVLVLAASSEPAFFPGLDEAQAAVAVEIGFGVFYDRLSSHGDWIAHKKRYVWVPRVESSWRPYLHGHWVYTKAYGWYWVSDEPFAWAVYHYGRWAFDPEIGWYWVPGRRWAPAWVIWSHTDDEIAWAPLPPHYDDDEFRVTVSIGSLPVHYWHAVPIRFFISVDLDDHIIRDRDHIRRVIDRGQPETVIVRNNVVVNNFIDVDVIEQKSGEKVVVHEVKLVDDPETAGKAEGDAIAVFNPEVKQEQGAKPEKVKEAAEVAREKKEAGTLPEMPAADTAAPDEQPAEGRKAVEEKKPAAQEQQAEEPAAPSEKGQAAETVEPAPQGQKPSPEQQAEEPVKKGSEKALEAVPPDGASEQPEAAGKPAKQKEEKQACDPATQECPQQ